MNKPETLTRRITKSDELLPRRLTEQDEFIHPTGTDTPERWQENMMVEAWDLDHSIGFWFHIQRVPAISFCELKYAVFGINKGASGLAKVPLATDQMYPGLSIVKPFELAQLKFQGKGVPTVADADLPCLSASGSIPIGIDVALKGLAGPIDWHIPLSTLMNSIEGDHYEMAGTWEGKLQLGDETINGSGLFFRDHTWGNRNYTPKTDNKATAGRGGFDWAWWTPVVLDEGRTFFNGLHVMSTSGHKPAFSTLTEGGDTILMPMHSVAVTAGKDLEICRYQGVSINGGTADNPIVGMNMKINRHLPMYLPAHGPDFVQSDGFGPVTWGDRRGWGSAQLSLCTPGWKSWPEFSQQIAAL